MGIDNIRWSGSEYMANLLTAKPRRNYINDQDRNGQIVVRTQDNNDAASQSEYVWVNFLKNRFLQLFISYCSPFTQ